MKIISGLITSLIIMHSASLYAEDNAKFQQCAVDLCGPTSKYARITARGAFALMDQQSKAYWTQEIAPQLKTILETSINQKAWLLDSADQKLNSEVPLNKAQKSLLAVMMARARTQKVLNECLTSKDGRIYQVSPTKLQAKMPELKPQEVKDLTAVLNAYLSSDYFITANQISGVKYELLIQQWGILASHWLAQVQASAKNLSKQLGPFVYTRINSELLDRMVALQTLSAEENGEAAKLIEMIYRMAGMVDPQVQAVASKLNINLKVAAETLSWDTNYKTFKSLVASPEKIGPLKEKTLNTCREAIVKSLAATPSALRQRKTDELLEQVKISAMAIAPQYFSGDALQRVDISLQNLKFTKPKNTAEVKAENQALITQSLRTLERAQTLIEKSVADTALAQSMALFTVVSNDGEDMFATLKDTCERITPRSFEDMAVYNAGAVMTGWQSNMFPEIGAGVLAHEVGHILSKSLSGLQGDVVYQETRTCAAEGHAKLAGRTDVAAFTQFQEEDWADSFAATTLNHLQKSWPYAENYACALLKIDDTVAGEPYKGLQLFDESNIDVHSPSLLRALQVQVALGKELPSSCQSAMSESERTVVGKVCGK